ncbi:MAG: histidine kinase [Flavobacterium sp.]|nr:histidine kinase [Flavobacterium sp.]
MRNAKTTIFHRGLLLHFLFWLSVLALLIYPSLIVDQPLPNDYYRNTFSLFTSLCISVYTNRYLLLPFYKRKKYILYLILMLLVITAISYVESILCENFIYSFIFNLLFVLITSFLHFYRKTYLENIHLKELQDSVELKLLKEHLNPHFFFNTLNILYNASITNSSKLPDLIVSLGTMMRYIFKSIEKEKVLVIEELNFIDVYLNFEKIRFSDHIKITYNKDIQVQNQYIPPMLFMPFIENAFKHSGPIDNKKLEINITIIVKRSFLIFEIKNTNSITKTQNLLSSGTGIANTKKRLEILIPNHLLRIDSTKDYYCVNLKIPF